MVGWLGAFVSTLAETSCEAVCEAIRGDKQSWVATYDGFYTRGHHSNNVL